jgi:signal transduction histidine kinase
VTALHRPRRDASALHNGPVSDTLVRGDERDPVLEEQLAHLDAIERRQELLYASGEAELTGTAHNDVAELDLPEPVWPESIGAPPPPDEDLDAYLVWLDTARIVLGARAARNRDELQRVSSQWVLAQRHLTQLRPEEVSSLVESQARLRERIAADETVCHLLRTLGSHLGAWAPAQPAQETPLPTADLDLVRRLLDESAEERARAGRELMGTVLEALCSVTLDMEVVQRQAEQQPQAAAGAVRNLQTRIADLVEDLRDLPHTELVAPEAGEPLQATLRRCIDHHQSRLAVDLAWSGGDHAGEPVGAAAAWITQEFLVAASRYGAQAVGIALRSSGEGTVVTLSAGAGLAEAAGGVEPGWLLRCRARAAVAGGLLVVDASPQRCAVEVRFPAG